MCQPWISMEDMHRMRELRDALVPTQWEWVEEHQAAEMKELSRKLITHANYLLDLAGEGLGTGILDTRKATT